MSLSPLNAIEKTLDPTDLQQVARAAQDLKRLQGNEDDLPVGAPFLPWTIEAQTHLRKSDELRSYKWRPIVLYSAATAAILGGIITFASALVQIYRPSYGQVRTWAWVGFGGFLATSGTIVTLVMAELGMPSRRKGFKLLQRRLDQLCQLQDAARRQQGRDFVPLTRTMIPDIVEKFRHQWKGITPSTEELTQVFSHLLPPKED